MSTALKDFSIILQTSESVERLGRQLEETVAALTTARDEARIKTEQLRRAQLDMEQLNDALGYEKDLNTSLHDQVCYKRRAKVCKNGSHSKIEISHTFCKKLSPSFAPTTSKHTHGLLCTLWGGRQQYITNLSWEIISQWPNHQCICNDRIPLSTSSTQPLPLT